MTARLVFYLAGVVAAQRLPNPLVGVRFLGEVLNERDDVATPVRFENVDAGTTLSAVTGAATGVSFDAGKPCQLATVVCVGTGTLAGTLTIEGSLDGTTWVSSGTTVALTAAATVTATATNRTFRFWRCSLSGISGTGTATAKILAA